MLRAIIADDESKICVLIQKLVDWDDLGIKVIGTAESGPEALSLIESTCPDIVITDIRMPGFDGIELIMRVQAKALPSKFIVISGYRQFEYAQKAIKYGVEDYLLKPINKSELIATLRKLAGQIRSEKGDMPVKSTCLDEVSPLRTEIQETDDLDRPEMELSGEEKNPENISILLAKQYIDENYAQNISLEGVADVVHLNPFYLSAAFKREEGINFSKYVAGVRMEAAKTLLRNGNMTVAQVAEKVGYHDIKHFRKLFQHEVGIRPSEYRKLYT